MKRVTEAVVLAAGLGLRMRPATLDWPKPALPFLNRPILHWILDGLQAAGVSRVLINLHHLPDEVRAAAESHGRGLEFVFSYEPEILGTAGLFGPLKGQIRGEIFLAANADVVHGLPAARLVEQLSADPRFLAALALRPGGPRYTAVDLAEDGRISAFQRGGFMFAGLYSARRELLEHLPPPGPAELVPDLLEPLLPSEAVRGVDLPGSWWDLGDARGYLEASEEGIRSLLDGTLPIPAASQIETRNGFPVLIHERSEVSATATFTGFAVVGEGARVGSGAVLGRCVLLPRTSLGRNERLDASILSPSGRTGPRQPFFKGLTLQ